MKNVKSRILIEEIFESIFDSPGYDVLQEIRYDLNSWTYFEWDIDEISGGVWWWNYE